MRRVSAPDHHQLAVDQRLFIEPMAKKTTAVIVTESVDAGSSEAGDERQERNETADQKGGEGRKPGHYRRARDRWHAVFLGHHHVDPARRRTGDHLDRPVEVSAFEPFRLKELSDLLALSLRHQANMALLHAPETLMIVTFRLRGRVVAGGHGEAVGEQVGSAQNEDDACGQIGADHASDNGEGGHRTVDAAVDPVPKITGLRAVSEARRDFCR